MNREPALAAAIARTVADHRLRRVPVRDLLIAAASVDRSAAAAVGWRARVLAAITDLAADGLIELPRTRLDRTAEPPLPLYVLRPAAPRPALSRALIVWHAELTWAAELDDAGALGPAERRVLTLVNAWLPRRRGVPVPLRERSLEVLGDEKELERWVLGPLFAPGRLTMELLDCYPCWPPVEQTRLGPGDWLVIENYTTYVSISRRARELDFDGLVVWGFRQPGRHPAFRPPRHRHHPPRSLSVVFRRYRRRRLPRRPAGLGPRHRTGARPGRPGARPLPPRPARRRHPAGSRRPPERGNGALVPRLAGRHARRAGRRYRRRRRAGRPGARRGRCARRHRAGRVVRYHAP